MLFASVFGFMQWMKGYEAETTTETVILAKKYIPAHTVITSEMFYFQDIDRRLKNPRAIHEPKKLIGMVTSIPIGTNEQFLPWKMDARDLYPNDGESYFTFKTDAITSVGNMIRRGDRVQIWLEANNSVGLWKEEGLELPTPSAFLVLSDAKVAYVKDADGNEVKDINNERVEQFFLRPG